MIRQRKPPMMALGVLAGLLALTSSNSEKKQSEPEPYDPRFDPKRPPSYVPRPEGWKGYGGTVGDDMKATAIAAVNNRETKLGQLIPGGTIAETGKAWAVFLEWHFHPRGQGFAAEGWHKGATILVER